MTSIFMKNLHQPVSKEIIYTDKQINMINCSRPSCLHVNKHLAKRFSGSRQFLGGDDQP